MAAKILVIDDSADNLRLFQLFFKPPAFAVTVSDRGEEGLQILSAGQFDIAFIDLEMPEMSGLEVIAEIRNWERQSGHKRLIVYAFTGHVDSENREQILKHDFDGMIAKPFRKADILAVLERHQIAY